MFCSRLSHQNVTQLAKRFITGQAVAQNTTELKLSQLQNGLKVATVNQNASACRIMLLVNTGSRDDINSTLGLTHALQASAGLRNSRNTAFLSTQLLATLGASLEVSVDREHIKYLASCHPSVAKEVINDILISSVLEPDFPYWEVQDVAPRMHYQKAAAEDDPCFLLMENAHMASFRGSMSNPIMAPARMIGKHSSDMMRSRYESAFKFDNMVLAATGIAQDELLEFAAVTLENHVEGDGEPLTKQVPEFFGREIHVDRPGALSHVAITFPGVALNDSDMLALGVLQQVMGAQTNIKRGSGLGYGTLNAGVEQRTERPFAAAVANINYSDCGLFAVHACAAPAHIREVSAIVASECAHTAAGAFSDEAVDAGKTRLASAVLMQGEDARAALDSAAVQSAVLGLVESPASMVDMIAQVTPGQVRDVARRVIDPAHVGVATVGSVQDAPGLRDLRLE